MDSGQELTIEQCLEQANRCRILARQAMTGAHRIMLEHIASTWERIAADIDARTSA